MSAMLARGGGAESSSTADGKPVALVSGGVTSGTAGIVLVLMDAEGEVVPVPSSEVGGVVTTPSVVVAPPPPPPPPAPPAPLPTLSRLDSSPSLCVHDPPSRSTHVLANCSLSPSFPGQFWRIWATAARMAVTAVCFC